jgi:GTP-binding protein
MKIISVDFVGAAIGLDQCPPPTHAEFAFIGRSNVGKSSLINRLVGRKAIAKVSGTPGKTRTINHYRVNGKWFLVDLPGYGFAKVAQSDKHTFNEAVLNYLRERINLLQTFLLIDSRHKPQPLDLEFAAWLDSEGLPFSIIFTKIDKLSKLAAVANQKEVMAAMQANGIRPAATFVSSAEKGVGKGPILNAIEQQMLAAR